MTDNLLLGPDAQVNHTISLLRSVEKRGKLANGTKLLPGAFLAMDPQGQVDGSFATGGGHLMRLKYDIRKQPRWLALHLEIGGIDLGGESVFGIVCKSQAPNAVTFRPCLRSATPQGFADAFLDKHVVAFSEKSTHIDLLRLGARGDVPAQAQWRELILFFQTSSAEFDIQDLRVFIA